MTAIRPEIPVGYATMVKRTIIVGMRSVFDNLYPDKQFQDLQIITEWPLDRLTYPTVLIDFQEGPVENFGIANKEWFLDPNNNLREWKHAIFNGQLDFEIFTLSPLDRDILGDALLEILLRFPMFFTEDYFNAIYGAPNDPYSSLALLSQLNVDSDRVVPTGKNVSLAPWEPEDVMVYQKGYSTAITGGFYNTTRTNNFIGYVSGVDLYPYIYNTQIPLEFVDTDNGWHFPFTYTDGSVVEGTAVIGSIDIPSAQTYTDSGVVIGVGVPSGTDAKSFGIAPPATTSSGSALIPIIVIGPHLNPPITTASASSLVPAIRLSSSISAPVATASASGIVPTLIVGSVTIVSPPVATASASSLVPTLQASRIVLPPVATSAASPLVPVQKLTQLPPVDTATASSPTPTLIPATGQELGDFILGDSLLGG